MIDRRLFGTWVSDRRRTMKDLESGRRIPAIRKKKLEVFFGRLRLRITRSRCYSTLEGVTDSHPYRVVAKNSEGVVVVGRSLPEWITSEEQIQHIHFVTPNLYWVLAGGTIREYFRRTQAPANGERHRARNAPARRRGAGR